MSRAGLGLCEVASLFHGCLWDEAGDDQHGPLRAQWDPAKHRACSFPVVVEGRGMDAAPRGTYELGQGLWSWEPVDKDLVLFVHVCKLLLVSCVGACMTLTGCLKSILEMSLAVFLISRAYCPRMTLPSGQVVEVDLGVWICLRNAIWLQSSRSHFPWS